MRARNSPAEPALSLSKGTAENIPGRQSWAYYVGLTSRATTRPGCLPGSSAGVLRSRTPREPSNICDCEAWFLPRLVFSFECTQDGCPGIFSAVPFDKLRAGSAGLFLLSCPPRTDVLGYSQPSLRDSIGRGSSHADAEARTNPAGVLPQPVQPVPFDTASFPRPVWPLGNLLTPGQRRSSWPRSLPTCALLLYASWPLPP